MKIEHFKIKKCIKLKNEQRQIRQEYLFFIKNVTILQLFEQNNNILTLVKERKLDSYIFKKKSISPILTKIYTCCARLSENVSNISKFSME